MTPPLTDNQRGHIDKVIDKTGELIKLELEKIETTRKLRKAFWLAKTLNVQPREMGPVRVHAVSSSSYGVGRAPRKSDRLIIKYEGETTEIPLQDVPAWVWPDTVETPHGPRPLNKPICNE